MPAIKYLLLPIVLLFCLAAGPGEEETPAAAPLGQAPTSTLDGVFTQEQAERGQLAFLNMCAGCHGESLQSADPDAPPLTGQAFARGWVGRTVGERFERIRASMPFGAPRSLSDAMYLDIIAFVLAFNGYPAGEGELEPDVTLLQDLLIEAIP